MLAWAALLEAWPPARLLLSLSPLESLLAADGEEGSSATGRPGCCM
jgi:hypothetical protein